MRQFVAYDERASFPWNSPLPTRTREQDLLTMFDEGGCILVHFKNKFSLPFLFGHGFYERLYYGDRDLSACTLEIHLDFDCSYSQLNENNELEVVLGMIDEKVSQLLFTRTYYEKEGAFKSTHLDCFMSLLK